MKRVLIDLSYLAYRAKHSMAGLTHEDYHTGIIYGFFEQLRTICQDPKVNSNRILVFFDSRKSYRRKAYPEYKSKRHEDKTDEEWKQLSIMKDQVKLLYSLILPEMGVPVYRQTGLEADDLMAWTVRKLTKMKESGIMITSDGDMYQCITPYVHWYDPARSRHMMEQNFQLRHNIHPGQWGEVKALGGCTSDNVAGIPGVGELTAIKYLNGALPETYKSYKAIVSKEGQAIVERNRPLVVLPHKKTKKLELRDPEFNSERFFFYCERYGLVSYLKKKKRAGWISFFGGRTRRTLRKRGQRRG